MAVYAEIWTRPGDANPGRVIDDPPFISHGMHDGMNIVGDGNASLPDTFTRFDEILKYDPDTPANSVACTVRLFEDSNPSTPFFEWIPRFLIPAESKTDYTEELNGPGIGWVTSFAKTDAYDWDGTDNWQPNFPDWISASTCFIVSFVRASMIFGPVW